MCHHFNRERRHAFRWSSAATCSRRQHPHRMRPPHARARHRRQPVLSPGPRGRARDAQRVVYGRGPHRPRSADRPLHPDVADPVGAEHQNRLLPVGGVPHRAAADAEPDQPGSPRPVPAGRRDPRARLQRAGRAGRRAGARQRRARPARGLLPGVARDPRRAGHRLRPSLRVRHLRPGDPRRLRKWR